MPKLNSRENKCCTSSEELKITVGKDDQRQKETFMEFKSLMEKQCLTN
jgi:hypothetical protein